MMMVMMMMMVVVMMIFLFVTGGRAIDFRTRDDGGALPCLHDHGQAQAPGLPRLGAVAAEVARPAASSTSLENWRHAFPNNRSTIIG